MPCCFCINGQQSRYEGGRGIVHHPCGICHPEEREAAMADWKPAAKPEAAKPAETQISMFEAKDQYPE